MKKITVGILAHVDAGKTTLSEALLFKAGAIDSLGRVDKKNAHLDSYSLERERGITIFSKQAVFTYGNSEITLIDTPGHVDFACEAERVLSVLDYAILVISAQEGAQAHTLTLWRLLAARSVPTFIFVNKTDLSIYTRRELMSTLRAELTPAAVDFSSEGELFENAASADEELMREFFETDALSDASIIDAVRRRRLFPCFFGSALKLSGVTEFLLGFDRFTAERIYPERLFGARVFKIARDEGGRRLTYVKLTGGTLRAKDSISYLDKSGERHEEKVDEIRIYSAEKYKPKKEIAAGTVAALLGLGSTFVGEGLGFEASEEPSLTPVIDYKMLLPKDVSVYEAYLKLGALTEEDPTLSLRYYEQTKELHVSLMGDIQLEVLKRLIAERYGIEVDFGEGEVLYRETIAEPVYGFGHFEPLRHYAEVHLLIEPLPRGSGLVATSDCSTDALARNWQRLAIKHVEEKRHRGVLIGAPLSDVKITLVAGKAHVKHTEGGDFRQAAYRAVRQGLMKARSVLLEPTFDFTAVVPKEYVGRVMTDVEAMFGTTEAPVMVGDTASISGNCPVSTMRSYASALRASTRGTGKLTLAVGDYVPCHNADEVIARYAYSPTEDERNPPHSVFCKNGAGFVAPWDEAEALMDLELEGSAEGAEAPVEELPARARGYVYRGTAEEDTELMRIFEATYGRVKKRTATERHENAAENEASPKRARPKLTPKDEYVFIDGYNYIFADEELRRTAEKDFSLARDALTRLVCSYSAFRKIKAVIVFDAYKRRGGEGSEERYGDVLVVYTKEGETADAYVERETKRLAADNRVRVVSADADEQRMVLGNGALRVSTKEFSAALKQLGDELREVMDDLRR